MSFSQSTQEKGFQASKEKREADTAKAIHQVVKEFALALIVTPDDGMTMALDAAFQVNRKALVIKALEQVARELQGKR
jgi:hypothetical protein